MQSNKQDFLVEILTEELPPKALKLLATSFLAEIQERLHKAQLDYVAAQFYATPRRIAVIVQDLISQQPDTEMERRGPAVAAAFDAQGKPTPACIGFARSCGATQEQLIRIKNAQGEWVGFHQKVIGKSVQEILPSIVEQALHALPIPKRMRWGSGEVEFVRPVHSVVMLYGEDVIEAEVLNIRSGRVTQGHRFLCSKPIYLIKPATYLSQLEQEGFVIADFAKRKAIILENAHTLVQQKCGSNAKAIILDSLLDEVTGLVEWPVSVMGNFEQRFLAVPAEALISAMQDHQRYFPVQDHAGKLLPYFITTSNIKSKDEAMVVAGNERVIRARLSDAAFFYETDKKRSLESRVEILKNIVFQAKLGTLFDKAQRISQLAASIAQYMQVDDKLAERAALLAKTDLTTEIVGEFPELQGIAGYYYALHDGETAALAQAMNEQYMPRFSGDKLPESSLGCVIAIADRLDSLVGVFGINQQPTGDKDPLGLRRSALGVLRILIEKKLNLDLHTLLHAAFKAYNSTLENKQTIEQVLQFMQERLKPWYQEQHVSADVFAAVAALEITCPYDFHIRIQAVQSFKKMPDAESLSIANKRVSNILAKIDEDISAKSIEAKLFETDEERNLAAKLDEQREAISPLTSQGQYMQVLERLSSLRTPVDEFFDKVMVMTENKAVRENRLLLLAKLRALFLQVADVALLQIG
jgi:glycyl-tRNA synthetase beta chain